MAIIYHYCSTPAFLSIVSNRSLRLSSLSLSNDTMEGKLVAKAFTRLAERDGLDQYAIRRLHESLEMLEQLADGLGFCLSEESDLLSQWRGYASDASGVCIGFDKEYLSWLGAEVMTENTPGFSVNRVVYDPDEQEQHVKPTYEKVKGFIEEGAYAVWGVRTLLDTRTDEEFERENKQKEKAFRALSMTLLMLFPKLFLLKAPAFKEEGEWRLVSYFIRNGEDKCLYRSVRDRIVPYREIPLLEIERQPIREIVLGPKHLTPSSVVEGLLRQHGFGSVTVRRSGASYR